MYPLLRVRIHSPILSNMMNNVLAFQKQRLNAFFKKIIRFNFIYQDWTKEKRRDNSSDNDSSESSDSSHERSRNTPNEVNIITKKLQRVRTVNLK